MCYIQLTAHSWQQAWFSTLHCEPGFSLHPLVSQHGSNSWQFFRKKWKEKGNFMWIKTFSQSEAGEGGCRFLQKKGVSFFVQVIFPKSSLVRTFMRTGFKWNIYFLSKMKSVMKLVDYYFLSSKRITSSYSLTSSLPQSHSSPCSTSPFPHLGLISCRR